MGDCRDLVALSATNKLLGSCELGWHEAGRSTTYPRVNSSQVQLQMKASPLDLNALCFFRGTHYQGPWESRPHTQIRIIWGGFQKKFFFPSNFFFPVISNCSLKEPTGTTRARESRALTSALPQPGGMRGGSCYKEDFERTEGKRAASQELAWVAVSQGTRVIKHPLVLSATPAPSCLPGSLTKRETSLRPWAYRSASGPAADEPSVHCSVVPTIHKSLGDSG